MISLRGNHFYVKTKFKSNDNIKIQKKLLNKYKDISSVFLNEKSNNFIKIKNQKIIFDKQKPTEIYHIAVDLFKKNHNTNSFKNEDNKIFVTNADIKESINKIYNDRMQNIYIKEHLLIFTKLGDIIESAKLINQTYENKNRNKYILWNYYFNGLIINNTIYNIEFDVVSRYDGENHYRIQRIKKAELSQLFLKRRG